MDSVFLSLLNVSITASWLVLAVLVIRLVFRKAPKWVFCLLWGIVAIRLVCPVSIESVFSLIPSTETVNITRYQTRPYIETGISAVDTPVNEYIGSTYFEGVTVPQDHFASVTDMLGTLWFAGMLAMLIYCAVTYLQLRRRVATATILEGNIRQCETVGSPFVLGIFKPTIYLPYQIQPEDMTHVIAHEKAHIRRKDHWWKPIGFIVLSVYWFNPVIWLAYILLCRDIEAACDEKVIRDLEMEERRAYSTALLNCSVHRRSIAACPLAFGEVGVKARVKNVMDYKKPAFWIILIALIVCIAVAVCFLTNPDDEDTVQYSGSEIIEWYSNSVDAEQISLSAFADTVFYGTNYEIYAVENGNRRPLVSGMPIHNAYFTDISGDGKPEICATVSFGSGMIDDHVVVYDYAAGEMFALWERGEFDYRLELENSSLLCMKSQYPDGETVPAGRLMIAGSQDGNGRNLLLVNGGNYSVVDSNPGNALHLSLPKLTLNDVVSFAQKGEALTWQDFSGYSYYDTGSGMNGRIYEIDETFVVSISGDSLHTEPTGIYLVAGWDKSFLQPLADQFTKYLDIRTGDVEAFIAEYSASSREDKISEAILAHYKSDRSDDLIGVESHRIIGSTYGVGNSRPILWETVYLMVLYQEYSNYAGTLEETSGSYIPTAITFNVDSSGKYTLQEYWEPRDGSYYDDDIREKFPLLAQQKAFNHQAYVDELEAECMEKAQKIADSGQPLEEIHAGSQSGGVSFSELEKIKDKLSAYMVEYKIATLDANEMTGMLDVELYERVEGLEELIGQYLDLKYVKISMFEGELRFPVLYGDPYGQRKVEVTEITSDQREAGYRIEAYLPATDLSSVWETEQIKAHIERFRNMTAMEWAASSQLADVAYIDADTWAECEQQIGFRVQNPLEDAPWLTHADSDGIPFDNGVDYIARHHVQVTAHILRNVSIRAGYLDGDVRIAFTATLQANNGNYSSGNIWSGHVTFDSDSLKTASGAPVLVITPSTTGRYTSLSAYWLQGNVLYSMHLVDEQNRQAQLEKTLSKLLSEF